MSDFSIKSKELIDFTLRLQKINDVALPIATQNALNSTVRDAKKRTLALTTNKMFDVNRPNFFKSNSGFQSFSAKKFNYNINKLHANLNILKSTKANEKATEQVAHQATAKSIKRSVNPLGNKPQKKTIVDILNNKAEFVENREALRKGDQKAISDYIDSAERAKKRNAPLVILSTGRKTGAMYRVKSFRRRKPTKNDPRQSVFKLKNIASYNKGGHVKLTKKYQFLEESVQKSAKDILGKEFVKEAEKQFARAMR